MHLSDPQHWTLNANAEHAEFTRPGGATPSGIVTPGGVTLAAMVPTSVGEHAAV